MRKRPALIQRTALSKLLGFQAQAISKHTSAGQ
jgi:hypothetical protein